MAYKFFSEICKPGWSHHKSGIYRSQMGGEAVMKLLEFSRKQVILMLIFCSLLTQTQNYSGIRHNAGHQNIWSKKLQCGVSFCNPCAIPSVPEKYTQ